jgi:hypothetical protein
MTDKSFKVYCLMEGDNRSFSVEPHHADNVTDLKKLVHQARANGLQGVDFSDLELWKVGPFSAQHGLADSPCSSANQNS